MSTLSRLIQKKPKKRAGFIQSKPEPLPHDIISKIREQLSAISLEALPEDPEPAEMLSPRSQRISELKKNMRELDSLMTKK